MSSIEGLLCENRSDLEIIQIIKAADQLYYKDKTLYTRIRPEFICGDDDGNNAIVNRKEQQQQQQGQQENNKKQRTKEPSEGKIEEHKKKNKKEKKGPKTGVSEPQQTVKLQNVVEKSPSNSKLQQVIDQAKKTVEQALNFGLNNGTLTASVNNKLPNVKEEELTRIKAENTELRSKLQIQEKRVAKLERITKKLLQSSGMTEADFSD